ncbi:hypothetical protein ACN28I_41725 [Archangium gephyra]|uniref:hypothetical protein n=1 Tax=Archangium gephyra TaxID=48 RepID=UPI003B7A0ABA
MLHLAGRGNTDLALIGLAGELGFDTIDAGPLRNARWFETLGSVQKLGTGIGFRRVR